MKKEITEELCRFLSEIEEDLRTTNKQAIQRRFITSLVVRIIMVFMFFIAIANYFLLERVSTGLIENLASVDLIQDSFTDIAADMSAITVSVRGIDHEVEPLVLIAKNMARVNRTMRSMRQSVHSIVGVVDGIESSVHQVGISMDHVDHQMYALSKNMFYIGEDVNRMSRPVKWMNKMTPW